MSTNRRSERLKQKQDTMSTSPRLEGLNQEQDAMSTSPRLEGLNQEQDAMLTNPWLECLNQKQESDVTEETSTKAIPTEACARCSKDKDTVATKESALELFALPTNTLLEYLHEKQDMEDVRRDYFYQAAAKRMRAKGFSSTEKKKNIS